MKKLNSKKLLLFLITCSVLFSCEKDNEKKITEEEPVPAKTRVYYIAAEEEIWDYAPYGMNMFMGMPYDEMDSMWAVNIPVGSANPRIGSRNVKARYHEYTDVTFTTKKEIGPEWEHKGILGPIIRGNVGDSIIVYFMNKTTIDASIHAHGVLYDVNSEGAVYNNGATGGGLVGPNESYMYKYFVHEESGPTTSQGSSTVWLYHSHVTMDESDIYAGLMGALIITKNGSGDENAKPKDIDREFVTLFMVINENTSALLETNINTFLPGFTNPNPEDFEESNLKHSINGTIMGNLSGLIMNKNEKVRWYLIALGNEVDLHTPHWHGNTVSLNGVRTDVANLLPAQMAVADMHATNPGLWGYHCHVSDHQTAGMTARYVVQ